MSQATERHDSAAVGMVELRECPSEIRECPSDPAGVKKKRDKEERAIDAISLGTTCKQCGLA